MPFDFSKNIFFPDDDVKKRSTPFGGSKSLMGVDLVGELRDVSFYCGQQSVENAHICLRVNPDDPVDDRRCFNHRVGLPSKDGQPLPLFDYETYLFNDMEGLRNTEPVKHQNTRDGIGMTRRNQVKYLAIKKSRGLGITEFFLRYMAWLAIAKNHVYKDKRFFIVCGPGENTALDLIRRIKTLVSSLGILEDTERTVCRVNAVEIVARPGAHVEALRGYDNIKFILVDEASFWTGEEQSREIRSVVEGYIAKTHPTIALISTPNVPGTMFENIMEEPDQTCLYKRYYMPYTIGLDKIYTREDIEMAKRSPNFEREYNLKFGVGIGNIFEDKDIDAITIPHTYQEDPSMQSVLHRIVDPVVFASMNAPLPSSMSVKMTCIGCDPGFGSSMASYVVLAWLDEPIDKIIVLDAERFEHDDFRRFSDIVFEKFQEYDCQKIFIDASARDFVGDLKIAFREETEYEIVKKKATRNYRHDPDAWMQRMLVVPIQFNQYGDKMLRGLHSIVMDRRLLIPTQFEDLILDLRMAREKNGKLDKSGSNTMDLFDALRLAILMFDYK